MKRYNTLPGCWWACHCFAWSWEFTTLRVAYGSNIDQLLQNINASSSYGGPIGCAMCWLPCNDVHATIDDVDTTIDYVEATIDDVDVTIDNVDVFQIL